MPEPRPPGPLPAARIAAATLALLAATLSPQPGHADPTVQAPQVPPSAMGALSRHHDGKPRLALTAELRAAAALRAAPSSTYLELGAIEAGDIGVTAARLGLMATGRTTGLSLRIDAGEALRVSRDDLDAYPIATVDRFIDDAALWWTPRVWASLIVGRYKVPFSRFRQLEERQLTHAVPFAVDRIAPDRRWGATFYGDLGAIAYAAGAYADLDAVELRYTDPAATADPSAGGRALASAYIGWTPRAPIGPDHMATPPSDPWFDTARPAAGLGVLWRHRDTGDRLDVSLNSQLKYRRLAAIAELLVYSEPDQIGVSAAAEASALVHRRAALFVRGDLDSEQHLWSAGGGASLFVTADRRNKLSLVGWARRSTQNGVTSRDAVLITLQLCL